MASRIIHLTITNKLIKKIDFKNTNSLIIGQLIPDATNGKEETYTKSHFVKIDNKRKYFNFSEFLDCYKKEIISDDLYLGY